MNPLAEQWTAKGRNGYGEIALYDFLGALPDGEILFNGREVRLVPPKRFTIKDVAQLAGVSDSTVSRVLNNQPGVSEKAKKAVLDIVNNRQYRPDNIARCLVTGRSNALAFVTQDIRNPFFAEIARGVEDAAAVLGYHMIYCSTDGNVDKERNYVELLIGYRVSGVIFTSFSGNREIIDLLRREGIAVILVNRYYADIESDTVVIDNLGGAFEATKLLIALGHTRIVHLGGGFQSSTSLERKRGYENALTNHAITVDESLIIKGDLKYKSGYERMKNLIGKTDFTAVFAVNDLVALGAWQACLEMSLDVPGDIAIVGFDDIELASFPTIALTTVRQPKYELGQLSLELLHKRIESPNCFGRERIVLPTELIVRKSSGSCINR